MAVQTARPSRAVLKTTVYYDDRTAPAKAQRLCHEHGARVVAELVQALTGPDGEPGAAVPA